MNQSGATCSNSPKIVILKRLDEIWVVEHFPVYTLGLNGKREHLLNTGNIPVINSDRGGQVTYHGPGQLVIYTLLDIKRLKINIRELVTLLEQAMIQHLGPAWYHCMFPELMHQAFMLMIKKSALSV